MCNCIFIFNHIDHQQQPLSIKIIKSRINNHNRFFDGKKGNFIALQPLFLGWRVTRRDCPHLHMVMIVILHHCHKEKLARRQTFLISEERSFQGKCNVVSAKQCLWTAQYYCWRLSVICNDSLVHAWFLAFSNNKPVNPKTLLFNYDLI